MKVWEYEWLWIPMLFESEPQRVSHAFTTVELVLDGGKGPPRIVGTAVCKVSFATTRAKRQIILITTGDVGLAPPDACQKCVQATRLLAGEQPTSA